MKTEKEVIQENRKLKRDNARLKEIVEDNDRRIGTKSIFFSQVGREFLNPIEILQGLTKEAKLIVATEMDTEEKRQNVIELLESIETNVNTLQGLHNCLWDSAIIENGMMKFAAEKFCLDDLLNQLVDNFKIPLQKKFLDLYVNLDDIKESYLIGDKYKLMKILEVMISQAIYCASFSTTIDLYVEQVVINSKKINVEFIFRYTGNRITKDFSEQFGVEVLNNTAVVAESNDSDVIKYTVCKYFMDMMDAEITLDTLSLDERSMIFDIPLEYLSDEDEIQNEHFADIHALVLADDVSAREDDKKLLMHMGIQCDENAMNDNALDLIGMAEEKKIPYNLIIIDDEIEDVDVLKFIREIRNIFGTGIHIAASAVDPENAKKKAENAGVDHLLSKAEFQKNLYQLLVEFEEKENEVSEEKNEQYHFENKWVLVVEDIPMNMEVVVKLLKRVNISVACAENGMEAVHIFESKPADFFDCILMDIQMPVMDGLEATKAIRESQKEDGKRIPIYAMTANALPQDIAAVLNAGMSGHISKPINVNGLYRTLEKVFTDNEADSMGETLRKKAQELMQENDLLRNRAERDPMTHLLNRYAFEKLILDLKSKETPVGFMLLDVDKFKTVNDTYGHGVGDRVLIRVANMLMKNFRATDYMVRFGGDEFAVILQEFDSDYPEFVVDKINSINKELLKPKDDLPPISLSAGVVFSNVGYKNDLYQKADKALYETKKKGRCGCTVYSEK